MTFSIDWRIPPDVRRQYASQVKYVAKGSFDAISDSIEGNKSDEFYAGLLSGLAAATTLFQAGSPESVGAAAAILADRLESQEATY